MDNEMIERLVAIQMKHNPQTKIGAAIVIVELLTVMREPTEKMLHNTDIIYKSPEYKVIKECYVAMIDAIHQ